MPSLLNQTCVRVSVTAIDSWLYWLTTDKELSALLQDLRGESPKSPAMMVGSALHKALEKAVEGDASYLEADGCRFIIQPDVEIELPSVKEFKMEREYRITDSFSVELVGKVDAYQGDVVTDYKLTGRFNPDRLMESFQWKAYLDMTGARCFEWQVFECDMENWSRLENVICYNVFGYHSLRQYAYPGMQEECKKKISEFVGFLGLDRMEAPSDYCTLQALLKANQ